MDGGHCGVGGYSDGGHGSCHGGGSYGHCGGGGGHSGGGHGGGGGNVGSHGCGDQQNYFINSDIHIHPLSLPTFLGNFLGQRPKDLEMFSC